MTKQLRKNLLAVIIIGFGLPAIAQNRVPVIKANAEKVDIKVGNDFFAKGGWILEPGKDPDVFSIGSKWPYKSKRVSFTTDIDSISFDVQAGHKYNFIIVRGGTICHIQISTLADPVFLNARALTFILAALLFFLLLLHYRQNKLPWTQLLNTGYWVVILFWAMTVIAGRLHGNYNHAKNTISELGAIGTKSELFTSSCLLFVAAFNLLFCVSFYKRSKEKQLALAPSVLSFSMPVSMTWAAIFTLGNEFHSSLGFLPFFTMLAALLSYFLWKTNTELRRLRMVSLVAFLMMMLILIRFINPFGHKFEGLVQRFFYLGWSTWMVGVSYYLSIPPKRK